MERSFFKLWYWSEWILWLLGAKPDAKQGRRKEACFLNIGGARSAVWWYKYIQIYRYDIQAVNLHWHEILAFCLLIQNGDKNSHIRGLGFCLVSELAFCKWLFHILGPMSCCFFSCIIDCLCQISRTVTCLFIVLQEERECPLTWLNVNHESRPSRNKTWHGLIDNFFFFASLSSSSVQVCFRA